MTFIFKAGTLSLYYSYLRLRLSSRLQQKKSGNVAKTGKVTDDHFTLPFSLLTICISTNCLCWEIWNLLLCTI